MMKRHTEGLLHLVHVHGLVGHADAAEGVCHSADRCGVRHLLLGGEVIGDNVQPGIKREKMMSVIGGRMKSRFLVWGTRRFVASWKQG